MKTLWKMDSISTSQFDEFLNFSNLFLLQISFRGDLINVRPRSKEFCGWSFENRLRFNFTEHFLKPNRLTFEGFFKLIGEEEYAVEYFSWRSPTGEVSSPYLSFFRPSQSGDNSKSVMMFIKNESAHTEIKTSFRDKRYIYQARFLPGFIHNLNGPLSTILGRIELLHMKHPQIDAFEEIVKVGYRLQSLMDNVSFKIQNEEDQDRTKINLNRLLREEINFLNCDLFFKHQVEKSKDFADNIPEFYMNYFSISGVLTECYHFIRQFMDEEKNYTFTIKSYGKGKKAGFIADFRGEFQAPHASGLTLPYEMEGGALEVRRFSPPGLDSVFLAQSLECNKGYLYLRCNADHAALNLEFPIAE